MTVQVRQQKLGFIHEFIYKCITSDNCVKGGKFEFPPVIRDVCCLGVRN